MGTYIFLTGRTVSLVQMLLNTNESEAHLMLWMECVKQGAQQPLTAANRSTLVSTRAAHVPVRCTPSLSRG